MIRQIQFMKLLRLLLLLFIYVFTKNVNAQTTGGPDQFGYQWANNQDTIGSAPMYKWIDIKDTANLVDGLGDDNSSDALYPGFYFNYYGQWYNTLWIGSNGWISFQNAGNIAAPFPALPNPAAPDNIIAGLLADLTLKDANNTLIPGAAVYYWTNNSDSIIVQYDSVPFWNTSSAGHSGRNTFQIILSGTDHSITYQYKELVNSTPAYDLINTGLRIGIEDSTGIDGLMVTDTFPSDSSAIKFFYPGHFSTNDLSNSYLSLSSNYPNPANETTTLNYYIVQNCDVKITLQDLTGSQIDQLYIGNKTSGKHTFTLDTRHYPAGIYFYTISTGTASKTGKMAIVR